MSLLTWRDRDKNGAEIGPAFYLEFDVTTLEEFSRVAEVTTYPVETGAVLSDHYQPQPRAITIVGVVTNTPVKATSAFQQMQNAAPPPIGVVAPKRLDPPTPRRGPVGIPRPITTTVLPSRRLIESNIERARLYLPQWATVLQFDGPVTRTIDVFRVIDGLMERRILLNVLILEHLEFNDMMIINHRAPRAAGTGGSVEFTIDLIQIKSVESVITKAQAQTQRDDKHKPRKDKGKKNPKPVEPKTTETSRIMSQTWAAQADPTKFPTYVITPSGAP
jgi:hypothetical protein